MDMQLWRDTVACLPKGRTLFYYGRDQYASMLLSFLQNAGWDLVALKQSRFKHLFDKPLLRDFFAKRGQLKADPQELTYLMPNTASAWRLTLDKWGGESEWTWNQTSRKGYNLVLQLNFTGHCNQAFDKEVGACVHNLLRYNCHPVSQKFRTLAWARLDYDLETGEVLIEEIQTDYIRLLDRYIAAQHIAGWRLERLCPKHQTLYKKKGVLAKHLKAYRDNYVVERKIWDEIMLSAVLNFCVKELGCKSIFMHQFGSGSVLKHISGSLPPQSLYTKLPRKFCFAPTDKMPVFLKTRHGLGRKRMRTKLDAVGGLSFWHLDLTAA